MKRSLITILLCLITLALSAQEYLAPGSKAEFNRIKTIADEGDVEKMFVVGCCYIDGVSNVVSKSVGKGKKYLQQAADKGYADACRKLYHIDPQEYASYREIAEKIYKDRATGESYYCIADMYSNSTKVCLQWLKASNNAGYAKAEKMLNKMYENAQTSDNYTAWLGNIKDPTISIAIITPTPNGKEDSGRKVFNNDVDHNIPTTANINKNTVALIIGNEHYQEVASVPFATNDAHVFAEYCQKILGLEERNIVYIEDATSAKMGQAVEKVKNIINGRNMDVIFYYAGHGIPDESTAKAYLLPTDVDGTTLSTRYCYGIDELVADMNNLNANSVVMFLDACFSGAQRGDGMLAQNGSRAIVRKPKKTEPQGNMVIFSATKDDQTAWPMSDKGHGRFTYYLLKKLRETQGNVTLGALSDYINTSVVNDTRYGKRQDPTTISSAEIFKTWRDMKIK